MIPEDYLITYLHTDVSSGLRNNYLVIHPHFLYLSAEVGPPASEETQNRTPKSTQEQGKQGGGAVFFC